MNNIIRSTFTRQQFGTPALRSGFTLVELMVVLTIMVVLLTITALTVNFSKDAERVRGGALQVQSFLAGARDRAIYAKEPRGVRFFLDPVNNRAVTTMVYIDPAEYWSDGVIQLQRLDANSDNVADGPSVTVVAGAGTGWWELKRRGLLFDGLRIRIPKGPKGTWYTISASPIDITAAPPATQYLILGVPYADPGDTPETSVKAFSGGGPEDYELELPPRILPQDPVLLPENTVIDLDGSRLPVAWRPNSTLAAGGSGNLQYSQFMDIIFSPRGNVIGSAASAGVIHLYVNDLEDSLVLKEEFIRSLDPTPATALNIFNAGIRTTPFIPADELDVNNANVASWASSIAETDQPYLVRDRRLVSVFTQTGAISIHKIDPVDDYTVGNTTAGNPDGLADDPFRYAESGETAN
ncbi:MAG: prepilin-type N-terminal cleavage/methylation domain-containing protein [Planctomyces sp.]|nr:prepilin-type N-terminal cleavage/methylation domain-containing protein [Planctomyces sp.]